MAQSATSQVGAHKLIFQMRKEALIKDIKARSGSKQHQLPLPPPPPVLLLLVIIFSLSILSREVKVCCSVTFVLIFLLHDKSYRH